MASPAFLARLVDHGVRAGSHIDTFRRSIPEGCRSSPRCWPGRRLSAGRRGGPRLRLDRGRADREDRSPDISADDGRDGRGRGAPRGPAGRSIRLRVLPHRWGEPIGQTAAASRTAHARARRARRDRRHRRARAEGLSQRPRRRGEEVAVARAGVAYVNGRGYLMPKGASGCSDAVRRRRTTAPASCTRWPSSARPAQWPASAGRRS